MSVSNINAKCIKARYVSLSLSCTNGLRRSIQLKETVYFCVLRIIVTICILFREHTVILLVVLYKIRSCTVVKDQAPKS